MNPAPYGPRERFGCAMLLMLAVALPVGCFALFLFMWRDQTPRGPLVSSRDWPDPIRELHDKLAAKVESPAFEAYLLHGEPSSTLSTVVCRLADSPSAFEFLQSELELKPVPADDRWIDLFFAGPAPSDWLQTTGAGSEYHASQNWLAGGEGPLFAVARDPQTHRLFLYYYFNF